MPHFFFNVSFIWSKDIKDLQKPIMGFITGYLFCLIIEKFEINITPNTLKKLFKEQNDENIYKNCDENNFCVNKKNKEPIFNINTVDTIKPQYVINLTIKNKKIENVRRKNVIFTVEHFNVNCNANKNIIKLKEIDKKKGILEKKYLGNIILGKISNMKYLAHKYFLRFYYKGLITLIKHKIDNNEIIDVKYLQQENNKEIQQEQKILEEGNNELEKKEKIVEKEKEQKDDDKKNDEIKVDDQKEKDKKIDEEGEIFDSVEARRKSRHIRKLLHKKSEERKKMLQKVIYRFEINGIMNNFKNKVRRISKSEIYLEKEVINNEPEIIKIEEKEGNEEGKNNKNLDLLKLRLLGIIINKIDRKNAIVLKKILEKWNIKVKIISLSEYDKSKKKKKKKKKDHKIENKEENKEKIKENEEKNNSKI